MRHAPRPAWAAFILLISLTLLLVTVAPARAEIPPWVEPRALNVVDLAGQVPDALIAGHIISYGGPGGLRIFESSEVAGDRLRIRVRLYPRYHWDAQRGGWSSVVGTLGQRPILDRMSSSTPESWVRIYQGTGPGSRDITGEVLYTDHADPDLVWPADAAGDPRYSFPGHLTPVAQPIPPDGVYMPANWGGYLVIPAEYHDLHAVFTVARGQRPAVAYLGEESFSYPSYIGPGYVGWFGKLMDQMRDRYDDRPSPLHRRAGPRRQLCHVHL